MKLMSFEEIVDRIRLPLDEFRKKYAPDSIESQIEQNGLPESVYSLKLAFKPGDGYSPAVFIHDVVAHELFVSNDVSVQHVILKADGTSIIYQECNKQTLLQAIKYKTPFTVEETVTPVVSE